MLGGEYAGKKMHGKDNLAQSNGNTVYFDDFRIDRELKSRLETQKIYSFVTGGESYADRFKIEYSASYAHAEEKEPDRLDIAETELAERNIISPVDGVLERESVEVGQYVQPGEILAIIQADGALQVIAHVNENEVVQMSVGQTASVIVAGVEYKALIESVGRSVKPQTGNYEIKLRIHGHHLHLREGMSARVNLSVTSSQPVLLVPRNAVVDRNRKRVVFVVKQQGEQLRAVARLVQFGLPDRNYLPVVAGLETGDQLIVGPMELMTDGVVVAVFKVQQ